MGAWFEDWFNSPYYHLLYNKHDDKEAAAFLEALIRRLDFQPNDKILDLACGSGRHTHYLLNKGFDAEGVDLAPNSIDTAKAKGYADRFNVWDMRKTYKPDYYRFVLNLFTSFGYLDGLEDELKTLKAINANLRTGGLLLIDFFNADCVLKNLLPEYTETRGDVVFNIKKRVEGRKILKDISFVAEGKSHHYQEKVSLIVLSEWQEMLDACGFTLLETFGNYTLEPYGETSPRLILLAVKD